MAFFVDVLYLEILRVPIPKMEKDLWILEVGELFTRLFSYFFNNSSDHLGITIKGNHCKK